MIAVTGATGQLGRLVLAGLLEKVEANQIIAAVRSPDKAADLAALGVQVREANYNRPETLRSALAGVDKLLLISSSELGGSRVPQHRAVIEAAQAAGVGLVAYTSILRADSSPLKLAVDHQGTEAALAASGLPTVLLRNGWYTENYLAALHPVLEHGALMGSAQDGRVSLAARADYAAAAVSVLTTEGHAGRIYELAGDTGWTLTALAAEIARQSGRPVVYRDLPPADYEALLVQIGLPAVLAGLLADADAQVANDELLDDGHALSRLIGRPTTPVPETVAAALRG